MNESYVRRRLIKALNDRGAHAIPVENIVASGMPDVNFCYQGQETWVEIKVIQRPARETSLLRIDHFTDIQRQFIARRVSAGGRVCLLLVIDGQFVLFGGSRCLLLGKKSYQWVLKNGLWKKNLKEIIFFLTP